MTEKDKRIIEEHVNSCENLKWTSLGEKLNRDDGTIKTYVKYQLRNKGKTRRGKLTIEESKKLIKAVFETNKNALSNSDDVQFTAIFGMNLPS